MAKLRERFEKQRPLIGRLLFEIVIIFVGVTAAFALEGVRQDREDTAYRKSMIAAMIPTFDDFARHNRLFIGESESKIAAFDRAIAAGEKPHLPIFREAGSERPPTRAWDGIVGTGVSKSLPPKLFFDLSLFYTRQESLGERYVRYVAMAERDIYPLGPDQVGIYDPQTGKLKPQFAAFVDRLRELAAGYKKLDGQAKELKVKLQALN